MACHINFLKKFEDVLFKRAEAALFEKLESKMSDDAYVPPRVWTWDPESAKQFSNVNRHNRPTAGANKERELPVGKHPLQLYSLASPNGQKVTILLEELLALGITGAEYDAWFIDVVEGDQFTTGFVDINPNSKIPAMLDRSGEKPVRIFESCSILIHLAEKFGKFLPVGEGRAECLSWLIWQVASASQLGGGFGHFYISPIKIKYAIDRFALEAKRQMDVLDRRLAESEYIAGPEYTIADIAIWPWYGGLMQNRLYNAAEFLGVENYRNLHRWTELIGSREAVQRGVLVNTYGDPAYPLRERHDSSDFDKMADYKPPE